MPDIRHAPRAPLPTLGVTLCSVPSSSTSTGITPPSSLLLAHAPDRIPPADFSSPNTAGLCWLLSVPAGRRPFPTLFLQSLCGRLAPYTAVLPCCSCPFLHREQRPPRLGNALGAHKTPPQCNFYGEPISVLQTFRYVQAPALARPPGCTHRSIHMLGGQALYTTHSPVGCLPWDVASLHARFGQLTWLDFHQLDCSLVGCSSRARWRWGNSRDRARALPGLLQGAL